MNRDEKKKAHYIGMCVKGKMTVKDAAHRLKLSERQVKNLKRRYREFGAKSMLHGNCGRQPKHSISPKIEQKIVEIKRKEEFKIVNFLHFDEILESNYEIKISYTALRKLLLRNGFKSPKKHRLYNSVNHPRRERRKRAGELLQTDATPYDWFQIGENQAIHAIIDDATSEVTGLFMSKNECAQGYLEIMRQTIENRGIPREIYADGLSLFFSNKKEKLSIEEQLNGETEHKTQFGTICDELGIELIHARSSQAKGRIERLWDTLQGRLPTELAMKKITTIEAANKYLREVYINTINEKFKVPAENPKSAFAECPEFLDLDTLLSMKYTRTLDSGGCFSFNKVILRSNIPNARRGAKIQVLVNENFGVKVLWKEKLYTPTPLIDQKHRQIGGSSVKSIFDEFVQKHCLKNEHRVA
jgi:transposase